MHDREIPPTITPTKYSSIQRIQLEEPRHNVFVGVTDAKVDDIERRLQRLEKMHNIGGGGL